MIYLDYQATTPLAPEAFAAMLPFLKDQHANPHSAHRPGRAAKAAVEVARAEVAKLLPPGGRVVFTSGATEALNWAIKGTAGPITTLASEHAAVLDTVAAEGTRGRTVAVLAVDHEGLRVPAQAGTQSTGRSASDSGLPPSREHTGLVSVGREGLRVPAHAGTQSHERFACNSGPPLSRGNGVVAAMLVNNEIGVIQPVAEIAARAHEAGALALCDAVQGYGRVPIPPEVDLIALSAHKVHGPKGIGALWIRDGVTLAPLLHGGDQEGGRSGTLSPALCAGFGVAARLMRERAEEDAAHVARLWEIALDALAGWTINGSTEHRYRGNLNVRRDGLDVNRLMSDCRDLAFSAGSACASGSGRSSHVLRAIGLTDAEARTSIRLGWGRYTTERELSEALATLAAAAAAQRIAA